jgi:hypothetical protein
MVVNIILIIHSLLKGGFKGYPLGCAPLTSQGVFLGCPLKLVIIKLGMFYLT